MITPERVQQEIAVFNYVKMPHTAYTFQGIGTSNPVLLLAARTNSGKIYTLQIDLDRFPNENPKVFVRRMLRTLSGEEMKSASASMHTLSSEHGYTRICHYGFEAWHPTITLFKVYVRCRWWLEAYEGHLQTGLPLDHWLKHAT